MCVIPYWIPPADWFMYKLQLKEIFVSFAGGVWNQSCNKTSYKWADEIKKGPYFSFLGKSMEFLKIKLLYKIDLILFGGHCCYSFEMAVKVALVKKTAFQANLR